MSANAADGGSAADPEPTFPGRHFGGVELPCGLPGRSKADFIAKLGIVLEEADEALYWLELMVETEIMKGELLGPLMEEAGQLVAIVVASLNTAKGN